MAYNYRYGASYNEVAWTLGKYSSPDPETHSDPEQLSGRHSGKLPTSPSASKVPEYGVCLVFLLGSLVVVGVYTSYFGYLDPQGAFADRRYEGTTKSPIQGDMTQL